MNRRKFSKIVGFSVFTAQVMPVLAMKKFAKTDSAFKPQIPIGVCNHSLRGLKPSVKELIEYAIENQLDSVLINTLTPFQRLDTDYLKRLENLANDNGVTIYIGVGSISERSIHYKNIYTNPRELLLEGIRVASVLNSPIVGCRIGSFKDRFIEGGIEVHIKSVIDVMKSVRSEAMNAGVKFAFENHMGDLRSDELNALILEAGTDVCGALFDPANALWAMEHPMNALKNLVENIICTSVRDVAVWEAPDGAQFSGMAIGEGVLDFQEIAKILRNHNPEVPLQVESISNRPVDLPYLKSDFRKGYPGVTDSDLTEFVNLVRMGRPIKILKPPSGMSKQECEIQIQKLELKKSINYLREHCNAGQKG